MSSLEWIGLSLGILMALSVASGVGFHFYIVHHYLSVIGRIFQEKPLFILPFGQPVPDAEEVTLATADGLSLQGCYMRTRQTRRGVVLFGLEFGSNRWACVPYCEFLREAGYDIFSFEMRGQGKSQAQPGYEPLQWVTDFEIIDFQAALAYLKNRPDKDPRGIGLFGLSKGGSAGLLLASKDDFIRCFVVDGIFAVLNTMVPYMKQWIFIYSELTWIAMMLPTWYYRHLAKIALKQVERERHCHYPSLERAMVHLAPRPVLMIHGGADNYIKPDMARRLFEQARAPKEFWLVDNAKHNQAFQLAHEEYKKRVRAFFDQHLAGITPHSSNGTVSHATAMPQPRPQPGPQSTQG